MSKRERISRIWRGWGEDETVPRWVLGVSLLANVLFCLHWAIYGG